jgi:hypothetical protein
MVQYRAALEALAQQNKIPFLKIRELTEEAAGANQGWFGELIHPNHMGHRLMASELLKVFSAQNMLPGFKIPQLTP